MAFDFLGGLSGLSNIAGPIASLLGAIHGPDKPKQLPVPPGEAYATSLYRALADPNNSLVKSMTDANTQQGMNTLQQQLTSQQLADRREVAMGRAPTFFDPERADSTISYMTSRGAPGIAEQGHIDALKQILASAQGAGEFAGPQTARDQNYQTQVGAYQKAQALDPRLTPLGRVGTGAGSIQQILDMFNGNTPGAGQVNGPSTSQGNSQYFPNSGTNINWNPNTKTYTQ